MKIEIETKELNKAEKRALLDTLFKQFKKHRKSEYQQFISIKSKKEMLAI